jgi:ferric enterobactin receptor
MRKLMKNGSREIHFPPQNSPFMPKKYTLSFLLFLFLCCNHFILSAQQVSVSGVVRETNTNKPIINASISILETGLGGLTDSLGRFTVFFPSREVWLSVSHTGHFTKNISLLPVSNKNLEVFLDEKINELEELTISGVGAVQNIRQLQTGVTSLSIKSVKKLPSLLGEVDIIKGVMTLPGVTSVGEGATGFNVRGGNIDQNLLLVDEAPIYNSSHLLGMVSIFNPDVVQRMEFYRGGVPAQYGGRAASVLQINLKDPKTEKIAVSGGLGVVSSRLMMEAPIIKDKMYAYVSARGSYADYLFQLLPDPNLRATKTQFWDITGKLTYKITDKDKLSFSMLGSNDAFKMAGDSLAKVEVNASSARFDWKTRASTLSWKRFFNNHLSSTVSAIYSSYDANISSRDSSLAFKLASSLTYSGIKADVDYQLNDQHYLKIGTNIAHYSISPANIRPYDAFSQINTIVLPTERAIETAIYVSDNIRVTDKISVAAGLRYAFFAQLGGTTYHYAEGKPRNIETLRDSTVFGQGQVAKWYGGLEPRLSLAYTLSENSSIKINYNRMQQFLQLLSNTTAALPTARWKISDEHIKPQIADQIALGYFQNLQDNTWETSAEVFYKQLQQVTDYKDGANLLLEQHPETQILQGAGFAYGAEIYAKKSKGTLTGWLSYTYSNTFLKITGNTVEETVNQGKYFPPNYNRPHILNLLMNYQYTKRASISSNFTYSSGRPITYPDYKFRIGNTTVPYFDARNQGNIPDYIRLDLGVTLESHPSAKNWSSWHFSIYNALARKNAYSVFFRTKDTPQFLYQKVNIYKLSVLGTMIPSLTYNFKF